jgi:hypothetical protein
MPMKNVGRDIALLRNAATGAFDSFDWDETNNPAFDDTDSHTVLSYVVETQYWANPQRGSKLEEVRVVKTGADQQLVSAAIDALTPAVPRQIKSFTPSAQRRGGGYLLLINYKNRDGVTQPPQRVAIGS